MTLSGICGRNPAQPLSLSLAAFAVLALSAPSTSAPGEAGSHQIWLRDIKSAQERALQTALDAYDAHLRAHPEDAVAAVEQCKLIAAAMARDDEEEDEVVERLRRSHSDCVKGLEERFPDSTLAVSYRIDLKWGKEASALAEQALSNPRLSWTDPERAHVHAKLSRIYSFSQEPRQTAREAWLAMAFDPNLDLTRELAGGLLAEGRRSEAIVALSARTDGAWFELQQKARLLADAGAFKRALWMMDLAKGKPSSHADPMLEARILEGAGKIEQARQIYAGRERGWNRLEVLGTRFRLSLEGNDSGLMVRSYQELRDLGWKSDPLGRYRLALLRKVPGARWRGRDWLGVLGLLGNVFLFALVPGLLLVPLHHFSLWRRVRGGQGAPATPWRFRDAWLAVAAMLVVQFLVLYLFNYGEVASWFITQQPPKDTPPQALAAFGLWDSVALVVVLGALVLSRRDRLRLLGPGSWSMRRTLGQALITLLLLLVANFINKALFHGSSMTPGAWRVDEMIRAMIGTYGVGVTLLAMAVLTPLAEELIFRSALLDLLASQLPFWLANLAQALLFASFHLEPRQYLPLLVVALLAGRLRRASGGLLSAILVHGANNALAVAAVALASPKPVPAPQVPMRPDMELIRCADALGPSPMRPAAGALEHNLSSTLLNSAAWALATEPGTSHACLLKAEEAVDAALRQRPETAAYLDTKATVLFRQQRLDEAIDLERAVADMGHKSFYFSQLDRFLRRRKAGPDPILIGQGLASLKLTLESHDEQRRQSVRVDLGGTFGEGVVLYALIADTTREVGILQVALGPQHDSSYRLRLPQEQSDISVDARFDVALVDARGCEGCPPRFLHWALFQRERRDQPHP